MKNEECVLAKKILLKEEGFKLLPYLDTKGILTIGVGRNLQTRGIFKEEALEMLHNDVFNFNQFLEQFNFYKRLSENRKIALLNMVFNLGEPRFVNFKKMITALENQDYKLAADEIRDSKYWRDNDTHGRAERIAKMIETDKMDPYYENY